MCCDSKGNIVNLVARWPGATNDSQILTQSPLFDAYEDGNNTGIVLGDSGYPCRNWLLTPYLRTNTDAQRAYNRLNIYFSIITTVQKP